MTDIVEWLRNSTSAEWNGAMLDKAADALEALQAERDAWKGRSDEAQGWSLSHLARAEAAEARVEALEKALTGISWKSADRDNMEFTARITCYQMDAIRALSQKEDK
jgi:hypothetical protein